MKKLFVLVLLFVLLGAGKCKTDNQPGTTYVFEQTYSSEQEALSITDAYQWTFKFNVDSIPLDQWINSKYDNRDGHILQRVIIQYSDTAHYDFIYTTFASIDSTWYQFKVRKRLK